jgi:hypothetical protein
VGSNPTSSALSTSGFGERHNCWSALGPLPVRQRRGARLLQPVGMYALTGEGLCVGYDGGDAVSSEYTPKFAWSGGEIVKVVFDVERHLAAAIARD